MSWFDPRDWGVTQDLVDAVQQIIHSGGVKNAANDVTNRVTTSGSGGGYAAPARTMASQAALAAYNSQAEKAKQAALMADAVLTGGIADPLARAGTAHIQGDSPAQMKALKDLAITLGINAAGEGAGALIEKYLPKIIQGVSNVAGREIGIHHSMTPGLDFIEPSGIRPQLTAADAAPGYGYFWTTNPADAAREVATKLSMGTVQMEQGTSALGKDKFWADSLLEMAKRGQIPRVHQILQNILRDSPDKAATTRAIDTFIKGLSNVAFAQTPISGKEYIKNIASEIPSQLYRINEMHIPEDWWKATAYLVDVPKYASEVDPNVLRNSASVAARRVPGGMKVVGELNAPNTSSEVVQAIQDYIAQHGYGPHLGVLNQDPYAFGNWLYIDPEDVVNAVRKAKIERFTKAVPTQQLESDVSNLGLLARLMARDEAYNNR